MKEKLIVFRRLLEMNFGKSIPLSHKYIKEIQYINNECFEGYSKVKEKQQIRTEYFKILRTDIRKAHFQRLIFIDLLILLNK